MKMPYLPWPRGREGHFPRKSWKASVFLLISFRFLNLLTMPTASHLQAFREECHHHLTRELLPFWLTRMKDTTHGGVITHFDQHGNDSGEDEKSLIAQSRSLYTMASAHRAGYGGGACLEMAEHCLAFLLDRMWDPEHGGFFWMTNRKGEVTIDQKILYGHSFAIYSLAEYSLASGDPRGLAYAEKVVDLIQQHAWDEEEEGYFEMFERDWRRCGPGKAGGDRKTLDVHMHLMEAFTTLYEASGKVPHRQRLEALIDLLVGRMLHPVHRTGIPQFWPSWEVAPQIKFDIVWGWDRFEAGGQKTHPEDNSSYGHNVEFAWLLLHALRTMGAAVEPHLKLVQTLFDHACQNGIDWEYGGVYVEGLHGGPATDKQKEFWQQAELLIGMLDAYALFGDEQYWEAYENVHRFVFDHMIHHEVGEWWPLLTRQGQPIWTHMSHAWKVNYHTVRAMVESIRRLDRLGKRGA